MTDFAIPCSVFARLTNLLEYMPEDTTEWFKSVRIDNGLAVVSNRKIIVVENIGGTSGVFHIAAHPALIAQCKIEAAYDSMLHIVVIEALQFATAKTSMGYQFPGNCGVWSTEPNEFDKWRSLVPLVPAKTHNGIGMFWNVECIQAMGASSPSGRLLFEETAGAHWSSIVRDVLDENWFAIYIARSPDIDMKAATLPEWMK